MNSARGPHPPLPTRAVSPFVTTAGVMGGECSHGGLGLHFLTISHPARLSGAVGHPSVCLPVLGPF